MSTQEWNDRRVDEDELGHAMRVAFGRRVVEAYQASLEALAVAYRTADDETICPCCHGDQEQEGGAHEGPAAPIHDADELEPHWSECPHTGVDIPDWPRCDWCGTDIRG